MLVSVLAVLQIIVCIFLILLIMVQDPKGGGGGLFGAGGSNSILGSSGGADFMTKLTRYTAIVFGALCIVLTLATRPSGTGVFSKGVNLATPVTNAPPQMEDAMPKEAAPAEATPAPAESAPKKETK
ncbi:MAG: preprotein translocase subunit SecG [Bdellovibrionaceae bacterium]|nr:preprotein translocase subunit SecG [Pseudobdellovibrionaceae bacterium]